MRVINGMTLFFASRDALSNWFIAPFEIKGYTFNCVEQAMFAKAHLFKDAVVADLILKAQHPKEQKALGRRVANYNDEVWMSRRERIVQQAAYAKFAQNPELREVLLGTAGTRLVEASPYDKVWGAGIGENDPRILQSADTWPGLNLLGACLENVRNRLTNELAQSHNENHHAALRLSRPRM